MKLFKIYAKNQLGDVVAVEEGLNPYGFLFGVFWAFYKSMWFIGILSVLVMLAAERYLYSYYSDLVRISMYVIYGFFGNDLLELSLFVRKYLLQDVVLARSSSEATIQYISKQNNLNKYV